MKRNTDSEPSTVTAAPIHIIPTAVRSGCGWGTEPRAGFGGPHGWGCP